MNDDLGTKVSDIEAEFLRLQTEHFANGLIPFDEPVSADAYSAQAAEDLARLDAASQAISQTGQKG